MDLRPVSTSCSPIIGAQGWTPVTRVPRRLPSSAPTRRRHAVTASLPPRGTRAAEGATDSVSSPLALPILPVSQEAVVAGPRVRARRPGSLARENARKRGSGEARVGLRSGPEPLQACSREHGGPECARPRGSARTSRFVAEVRGRCPAPNKFSERAAKTAVRRE